MSDHSQTLSLNQSRHSDRQRLSQRPQRPQRHNGPKSGPKPRKLEGHESVLMKFKRDQSEVEFCMTDGSVMAGTIRDFDRFSVTVVDAQNRQVVIFKHAMQFFAIKQ